MIRQIARLTRPIGSNPDVLGIAVYAEHQQARDHIAVPASDAGFEGVACIDDAARAAVLFSTLWSRERCDATMLAASGYLRFVESMQNRDGLFANFVTNWDGEPNLRGLTSYPGGEWWTARAMHALAVGYSAYGREDYRAAYQRGLTGLLQPTDDLRVLGISLLSMLEYYHATRDHQARQICHSWAHRLADSSVDGVLADNVDGQLLSTWAHTQEGVLALAATLLEEPSLLAVAATSARTALIPAALDLRFRTTALPYDVSSLLFSLRILQHSTTELTWLEPIGRAVAWFAGENAAKAAIYDDAVGCVYDGIHRCSVNRNSGAESNLEGAFALHGGSAGYCAYAARVLTAGVGCS